MNLEKQRKENRELITNYKQSLNLRLKPFFESVSMLLLNPIFQKRNFLFESEMPKSDIMSLIIEDGIIPGNPNALGSDHNYLHGER
jgi:hypothetical protein